VRVLIDVTNFDGERRPWAKGSGWPLKAGKDMDILSVKMVRQNMPSLFIPHCMHSSLTITNIIIGQCFKNVTWPTNF